MNGQMQKLGDSEKLDRLRLIRTDGVGPRTFSELGGRYGSAGAALDALPALARKSRKSDRFRVPSAGAVRAEFDSFAGANVDALSQPIFRARMKSPPASDPATIEFKDEKQSDDSLEKIAGLRSGTPTGVDEPVRECHMSAAAIQTALLELELEGRIERHPRNRFFLVL
ncbi:MAG: hypothetical protein VW547_11925 [Alphaproteobacteria bacterium]